MNNDFRRPEFDIPDSSMEMAIRAVLAEPLPQDAVQRVTKRAQELATIAPGLPRTGLFQPLRRKSSRAIAGGFAAAAMLAVMAVGVALLTNPSDNRGFAQMLEKVGAARTVQYYANVLLGPNSIAGPAYVDGNRSRTEQDNGDMVSIVDFDRRIVLIIEASRKRCQWIHLEEGLAEGLANEAMNAVDRLRLIQSNEAQFVGEEELEGRPTLVYQINGADILGLGAHNIETTVWINIESNLPEKIVVKSLDPNNQMEVCYANFVWDAPLDPKLFSLEVPEGYEEITDLPSEPVEATLLN